MKAAVLILLTALPCPPGAARAATNDCFADGVAAYRLGQFARAARDFEKAAATRPAAGTLVNLGLSEWQCGHAGPAILAWERARWLDPFDARARENLRFARHAIQVEAPGLKWFETLSGWLPAGAWLWLAGANLSLATGLMLLPGILRRPKAGWHQAMAAGALCVFLFSLTANVGVLSRTRLGFVLEDNAPLRLTPTRDGEVTATLTGGEPARKLRTRGKYDLIRTEYGTGWIDRGQFGLVSGQ
ncbi:MAG: hypothetical protein KGJ60_06890 [Verrucomicrobiota bacterium]|nr:hypothetical protein [Verrucomicrobiota bacterium]